MKADTIIRALGAVEDRFIEEARLDDDPTVDTRGKWVRFAAIAACFVILCVPLAVGAGMQTTFGSDDVVVRAGVMPRIAIMFGGEKISLTYDKSRASKTGYADIYKDEKGDDYIFKNGVFSGYYSNNVEYIENGDEKIDPEAAKQSAREFAAAFGVPIVGYDTEICEFDGQIFGKYYVTFHRRVGWLRTEEYVGITVGYDGKVQTLASYSIGEFDDTPESVLDGVTYESLAEYAEREAAKMHPTAWDFKVTSMCLAKDGQGYYVSIFGEMKDGDRKEYYCIGVDEIKYRLGK